MRVLILVWAAILPLYLAGANARAHGAGSTSIEIQAAPGMTQTEPLAPLMLASRQCRPSELAIVQRIILDCKKAGNSDSKCTQEAHAAFTRLGCSP
jgi:hypothetical protein